MLSAGGVRKYDYEIGRFTSVDPLWEKYTGWTGYQYSGNNPVNMVDFSGLNWFITESGSTKWFDQQGDFSQISSGATWTDIGSNVIVGRHNRGKKYSENVGSANFEMYLESNTDGPTATESGNTVPTNINKRGVLSEGLYQGIVTSQKIGGKDRGKFVVLLEKGSKLKSLKPNPAHNNELVMDEIFLHWGSKSSYPSSNGCQTIAPGDLERYNKFMENLKDVKSNPVRLKINYYLISK